MLHVPAGVVLVKDVTGLLLLLPNTAITLTAQMLPGATVCINLCVVTVPLTVLFIWCVTDDELHMS